MILSKSHSIINTGLILYILIPVLIHGQSQIDNLTYQFNNTEDTDHKIELANKLVTAYAETDRKKAIHYCEEAIVLSEKLNRVKPLGKLYLKIGRLWELEDYYLIAISYYNQSLKLIEDDKKLTSLAYFRIANTERKLCRFQNAIGNCYNSKKLAEEINDSCLIMSNINCLGNIYNRMGEPQKALDYFDEMVNISIRIKDNRALSTAYNNKGVVYSGLSQHILARDYYLKALELNETESKYKANTLNNLASVNIALKEFPKARKYHDESFKMATKCMDKSGQVTCYITLGEYYMEIDSINQAKKYFNLALKKAIDMDLKLKIKDCYLLLHEIYSGEGDYKNAYAHHIKYKEVYDDIYSVEKSKQMAYIESRFKNSEIKEQEEIARLKKNFIIICCLIFVTIVLGFVFVQHQNRLKQERLEKKVLKLQKKQIESSLVVKNKELSAAVLNQARVNGLIEKVKQELTITKYDLKKENQKPIQSIINDLNTNLQPDIWQEFELRFIEVHKDFYTTLLNKYQNLTPNEQRLCALLKLNMSTKEISIITNQSIQSIETARYRLRKKLNIVNKDVCITNYLTNLQ